MFAAITMILFVISFVSAFFFVFTEKKGYIAATTVGVLAGVITGFIPALL